MGFWKSALAIACIAALGGCEQATPPAAPADAIGVTEIGGVGSEIMGTATAHDGDDLIINSLDIRLNGFDAPERGKRCGEENVYNRATRELASIVEGQQVSCAIVDVDDDNRPVGRCSVNGEDVGQTMVSRGWARDWPRYSQRRYAEAETEARGARRGIWALDCPPDVWSNRNYD